MKRNWREERERRTGITFEWYKSLMAIKCTFVEQMFSLPSSSPLPEKEEVENKCHMEKRTGYKEKNFLVILFHSFPFEGERRENEILSFISFSISSLSHSFLNFLLPSIKFLFHQKKPFDTSLQFLFCSLILFIVSHLYFCLFLVISLSLFMNLYTFPVNSIFFSLSHSVHSFLPSVQFHLIFPSTFSFFSSLPVLDCIVISHVQFFFPVEWIIRLNSNETESQKWEIFFLPVSIFIDNLMTRVICFHKNLSSIDPVWSRSFSPRPPSHFFLIIIHFMSTFLAFDWNCDWVVTKFKRWRERERSTFNGIHHNTLLFLLHTDPALNAIGWAQEVRGDGEPWRRRFLGV